MGYPRASQVALVLKNLPANARDIRDKGSTPGSRRFPWRTAWQPTPVFLPGESQGQRSPVGYSPWGCKESDITEATYHTVFLDIVSGPIQRRNTSDV